LRPPSLPPSLPATLVGCSSKSYFDAEQATRWGPDVVDGVAADPAGTDGLFICPSFPLIPLLLQTFGASGGLVGAQDVSVHPRGPYTGEVSAEVLAQLGVRLVMAGHPERRRLFGETDDVVRRKVTAAAAAGMAPILVVGEQEEGEPSERAVAAQLDAWLADLPDDADVLVAYEPAWAIGRPRPAPPGHVADTTLAVRGLLAGRVRDPRVIYGGSAQPGTFSAIRDAARESAAVPDGVFMARFGLDPKDFLTVVREVRGEAS
jgi:triosephosphate isomerase